MHITKIINYIFILGAFFVPNVYTKNIHKFPNIVLKKFCFSRPTSSSSISSLSPDVIVEDKPVVKNQTVKKQKGFLI